VKKYLYLTKKEWVATWENGGTIPIPLASRFLSDSRDGTNTPDENLIHRSNVDLTSLAPLIYIPKGGTAVSINISGATVNGVPFPDILDGNYYQEDGLILSLSNQFDRDIAKRLKKEACVVIHDVEQLKDCLDQQLEFVGKMGPCVYAEGHQRNHFLKSVEDAWQDEYRLFWPIVLNKAEVLIPAGLVTEMTFDQPLPRISENAFNESPAVKEFTARELNSIRALIIGYLRRAGSRSVDVVEMSVVVLKMLQFNFDKSHSVFRQLTEEGLVIKIAGAGSHATLELTPVAETWKPRVHIDSPDPEAVLKYNHVGGQEWW
jgi:hypothetical protein